MSNTISVSEFKSIADRLINSGLVACVDVNNQLGLCSASPISLKLNYDDVKVFDSYPEVIMLKAKNNVITIGQINTIDVIDESKHTYEVHCGFMKELEWSVRIRFDKIYCEMNISS